jgi:uncharacterized oligopeptide transporter (OPT) family protein
MSAPAGLPALTVGEGSRAAGSARAWVLGGALGVLFAVSNVYAGLKTGFWESGCVTSALLAFGGLSALGRFSRPPSPLETNLSQTTAVAVGAMPASAGLMGTVPALALLGFSPSGWAVATWGLSLGVLGVLFASVLRRRLLEEERLPFPTGAATAELISTLHATGSDSSARARGLGVSGLVTALVVWLRDVRGVLPGMSLLPGSMTWGVGWNPMMLGMGALLGVQAGVSLLLGAIVAWGALAPGLVSAGQAKAENLSEWLVWPGLGLMLGASVPSLISLARALPQLARDLRGMTAHGDVDRTRWAVWSLVPLVLGALAWNARAFELGPGSLLLALALAFPLCAVCARATGQSDIAPMSPLGQLAEVGFGMVAPGQPGLNVGASGVVSGAASQTSASLWSLQAGRLLGANPSHQLLAQLSGLLLGAAVAVPTYFLLVSVRGLGSTELPAPIAHQFKAIAELTSQGLGSMPPGSVGALGVAFAVGVALSLARGRWARVLPSAAAVGMGFLLPVFYSVTICLGALLAHAVVRLRPASAPTVQAAGSGAILGESLLGVVLAALG